MLMPVSSHLSVAFNPVDGILLICGIRISTREVVPEGVSPAGHMVSLNLWLAIDTPGYCTCLPCLEI